MRIWQANIGKVIVARVPMQNGGVQEEGDFLLDGVAFPAAPIELDFLDPALLARCEALRTAGAVAMGLAPDEAAARARMRRSARVLMDGVVSVPV